MDKRQTDREREREREGVFESLYWVFLYPHILYIRAHDLLFIELHQTHQPLYARPKGLQSSDGSFSAKVRGENEKFINQSTDSHNDRASGGALIEKFTEEFMSAFQVVHE